MRTGSSRRELEARLRETERTLRATLERLRDLQALAFSDPLTGLHNRRSFEERLQAELSRAARDGANLSVLAIDVNDFKLVNDSFGHAAGDELLRTLARLLRETFRAHDVVCRTGGDEFLVILPGSGPLEYAAVAERLQQLSLVSVSVGFASFPRDGATAEALVARADAAMYDDKRGWRSGRTRQR